MSFDEYTKRARLCGTTYRDSERAYAVARREKRVSLLRRLVRRFGISRLRKNGDSIR